MPSSANHKVFHVDSKNTNLPKWQNAPKKDIPG
jgi:hypothetical protein